MRRLSQAEREAARERLKLRWRAKPEEMKTVLTKANAKASKRNKTRWKRDREKMVAIASTNAAQGTAVLRGSTFSRQRLAAHSAALTGRLMGGRMAKGPENIRSKEFCITDPEGRVWRGLNLLHFVRSHRDLFAPADVEFRGPGCNAFKQLNRVLNGGRPAWKGWEKAIMTDTTSDRGPKSLEQELIERKEVLLTRIRELRAQLAHAMTELEPLDIALRGFGHGTNSGLSDGIRKALIDYGAQTPEQVHSRLVVGNPTLTRKDVSGAMSHMAKSNLLKITREGGRGKARIYALEDAK